MKRLPSDIALLVLRIVAGAIFLPHGYSKVFSEGGVAAFAHDMPGYGIPAILGYFAAYSEFFGAILLIAGLLTRLDAFLLACTMAAAVLFVQLPDALRESSGSIRPFSLIRGVELPLSMLGSTLALLLLGPGRWSLDAVLGVERKAAGMFRKETPGAPVAES
jgi:putative oxidoreductase